MQLRSVNVGRPKPVDYRGKIFQTAIFKDPIQDRVQVTKHVLEGDGQADLDNHGGEYMAVYAYPFEHYDYWATELERNDFVPGQFGENLTVEGLLEDEVYIGDVYKINDVFLQVTQPRYPCYKLDIRMGLAGFNRTFHDSARVGFYFRVLEIGDIGAGDTIERISTASQGLSVADVYRLMYTDTEDLAGARVGAALEALSPEWRDTFAKRLEMGGEPARTVVSGEEKEDSDTLVVTFEDSGQVVAWNPKYENLLDFAEAQGLDVSFGCREGNCHTCACELMEGEVDYVQEPELAPDEGDVLICCAVPKTDIVVDL
jgi:MOSC domain-containing protein YiiM/ferredoxin